MKWSSRKLVGMKRMEVEQPNEGNIALQVLEQDLNSLPPEQQGVQSTRKEAHQDHGTYGNLALTGRDSPPQLPPNIIGTFGVEETNQGGSLGSLEQSIPEVTRLQSQIQTPTLPNLCFTLPQINVHSQQEPREMTQQRPQGCLVIKIM
jgi:hypothetical protein